ncbi:glycosyltransferase family 2 protein [Sphingobacterium athyrii]|uniref:Glycosyl transferase family 2 n=1 Tax=Sphingobacterium athyrii TaxID=2152717 RepID=A0A363NQB6_9SPHI|nr:glycosyltransferase [Sphingobacterium athyrii]PUV22964.1 glycosyl transferase family 2 [Sphingobacterium athyrii]
MMKLLSVILPVYNADEFVFESIKSILDQSFVDFELIIINDGSTDNSMEVIKKFKDDRIIFIDQPNRGLIDTLNMGLELSKGKYIARMDADDIAHPKRFEIQLNAFREDEELVLCSGGIIAFSPDGYRKKRYYPLTDADMRSELLFNSSVVHPLAMFSGDIVRENNIKFDKDYKFCEDYKFFYDLSRYGKIKNIPTFLLNYRVLPYSQTSIGSNDAMDRYIKISGIHRIILNDYKIVLNESWSKLHYSLSLSSEIERLEISSSMIHDLLNYSRFLVQTARFNKNIALVSLKASIGEKFLKIILFHMKRGALKKLRKLFFHKFTLLAVFKRMIRIMRYV